MTKKELSLDFINKIGEKDYTTFYRFFTKDTTYYLVSDDNLISYEECLNLLQREITSNLEIKRYLESKVCIKIDTLLNNQQINFFFDNKNRRITRLEIEFVK